MYAKNKTQHVDMCLQSFNGSGTVYCYVLKPNALIYFQLDRYNVRLN